MKNKFSIIIGLQLLILFSIFVSCAQQVPPDGGQKDEVPPKVIGSKPINKSIQFNSEKAEILFDEYIQIKDLKNIIISPKISQKPVIIANGKKLEIEFTKNSLDINTTYTVNIGNAIADIHEGKLIENYNYIFSTGTWIDSNQVTGIISDSETNEPLKDVTVTLSKYPQNRDSTIYKKEITYLTKTNENGYFNLTNLTTNTYELLAFKDENNNNQIDKNEKIGFSSLIINTNKNKENTNISIFKQPDYQTDKILDTIYKTTGIIKFIIYDQLNAKLKPLDTSLKSYWKKIIGNEKYDTIQFYIESSNDSIPQKFIIENGIEIDTIIVYGKRIKSKNNEEQSIKIIVPQKEYDSIHIEFKQPVKQFNSERIVLTQDSIKIKNLDWKKIDEFNYFLRKKLDENINYSLEVNDSATINIYKKYSKSQNIKFKIPNKEEFGTINLINSIGNKSNEILIQLKDNKEIIFNEKLITGLNTIKYIKPGTYNLRLVNDTNKNNKWDNGNVMFSHQPEKIKIINKELKIKANWETEIILSDKDLQFP